MNAGYATIETMEEEIEIEAVEETAEIEVTQ